MSPWKDAKGIAAHLGVSDKTVQNLTGPNVPDPIPFHRPPTPTGKPGRKRFYVPEVDEWGRRDRPALTVNSEALRVVSTQTGGHRGNGPAPDTRR
jgi:hypothetical protein